ncbi:MAG: hypothetical protein ABJN26_03785 [Stappiaceae bacterium]
MRSAVKGIAVGLTAFALSVFSAQADKLEGETERHVLRSDRLAVLVHTPSSIPKPAVDGSEMDIWIGEVEFSDRRAVWVELIDSYGEVIYDSEIKQNETHLLPDGRAIVVRALADDSEQLVAKAYDDRVTPDANMVVTRRIVDDSSDQKASVEYVQETRPDKQSTMMMIAKFGNSVWDTVAQFVGAAVSSVQVAWAWIVDSLTA